MITLNRAAARAQKPLSETPFLTVSMPDGKPWMDYYRHGSGYLVRFNEQADFEISSGGKKVVVHPELNVPAQTIDHLYQNQALPLALSLQKKLVLHGSAVEINGKAVAFLGLSGRGKSTLAASFALNGYAFLTDDGLQLDKVNGEYIIPPSHPSLRLWDDSRVAMLDETTTAAPASDRSAKAKILADETFLFCADERPLGRVYFLGEGNTQKIAIKPVTPQQAFVAMLEHCFLLGIDEREILANNFQQLSDLSRLPVFFSLDYPRNYDTLLTVRDVITHHLQQNLV